jgi:hypothetical protein
MATLHAGAAKDALLGKQAIRQRDIKCIALEKVNFLSVHSGFSATVQRGWVAPTTP